MDLKVFDTKTKANSGIWIDIINPNTGEPSGIRWKIAGLDSDRFTDFSKRAASNGKLRKAIQDKEEEYEYDIEMVAELSLGWEDTEKTLPLLEPLCSTAKSLSSRPRTRRRFSGRSLR